MTSLLALRTVVAHSSLPISLLVKVTVWPVPGSSMCVVANERRGTLHTEFRHAASSLTKHITAPRPMHKRELASGALGHSISRRFGSFHYSDLHLSLRVVAKLWVVAWRNFQATGGAEMQGAASAHYSGLFSVVFISFQHWGVTPRTGSSLAQCNLVVEQVV